MQATVLLVHFVIAIFLYQSSDVAGSNQCTSGDVRLVGGSGDHEGNVQVCINETWGYVCDNSWDSVDAKVVCRQLGFSTTGVINKYDSYFGFGNGYVLLDNLKCSFSTNKLTSCSHGPLTCDPITDIAGVICSDGGNCTNGDIRLIDQFQRRSDGRVEVCYNNEWGVICSTGWSHNSTQVACRQLGYKPHSSSYSYEYYSYYTNKPVWFRNVDCEGNELSLFNCSKDIDNTGCTHGQHVRIHCYSTDESFCTDGAVRLWSAYDRTPASEGMIQICRNGKWHAMCAYYYSYYCSIGKIVCKSLGYLGALALKPNAGYYYGDYYYSDPYEYYCYSYHSTLSDCYRYSYYQCVTYYGALGVACSNIDETVNECNNGDVRLVNGNKDNEGRAQYCYNGKWSPMCSLSLYTATLFCKKLGYTHYKWVKVDNQETFGVSNIRSKFNYVNCYSSSHTSLSQCSVYTKNDGCYILGSTCSTEYGLTCIDPIAGCKNGELRLVDGDIEQEGRPEVCFDGIWGTICDYSWDRIDAYIFCKTLGYDGSNPTVKRYGYFGRGLDIPVWSYMRCYGWEDSVDECPKDVYPSINCYNWGYGIAGVKCRDKCEDGKLRLVGGEYNNEGTVELCYNNLWGQISDVGWSNEDAKVVCNYLGYKNGVPTAMLSSHYGKSNKTIHAGNVQCSGSEYSIKECHKTQYSLDSGKQLIQTVDVAGVDCIYDEPTPPPCIVNPAIDPSDSCSIKGSIRLMKDGVQSTSEGRVEYCNGTYWSPLCTMDNKAATVVCKQFGHTQYYWGKIFENGEFGSLLNYSLVQKISCSGSENSVSQCTADEPTDSCLPWCPNRNIGLKCFANNKKCVDGSIRLVDGVIEQGGRVEICLNGVWGSVCDKGWDTTDGHVVCRQMGFTKLKPYVFNNSHFGDGQYPIVYSDVNCGGWEDSLMDCEHTKLPEFTCSRENTAGVLCGYDCVDGDVRLVQSPHTNEGTVEVCFSNLWGLIENSLWSLNDAKVVCTQLGYGAEGTEIGSGYSKPNKTVHLTDVQCTGSEASIKDCTQETYSLREGIEKHGTVDVAGVKCYAPSGCVSPPDGGSDCINGSVRLSGGMNNGEGILEYCYKGLWSPFCSLNETEAIVACRQLGYNLLNFVSIFTDGRYSSKQFFKSLFEHITCGAASVGSLQQCLITDHCQSTCESAIGIKCFEPQTCNNGEIRLKDGAVAQEGRIEVCYNNIWGSVCGDGFDFTDAYVACKTISISEPTVYTDSEFGDGSVPIVYSNIECKGFEESFNECSKKEYGSFICSRKHVAGVRCLDGCREGNVRLIGGQRDTEGTVEVCFDKVWGLISASDWNDNDASVVCSQIGYLRDGSVSVTDSSYGKPNRTVHLGNVDCTGSEETIEDCKITKIPHEGGIHLYKLIQVAGVSCLAMKPSASVTSSVVQAFSTPDASTRNQDSTIGLLIAFIFALILLVLAIAVIIGLVIFFKRKDWKKLSISSNQVTMSSILADQGVVNPTEGFVYEDELKKEMAASIGENRDDLPILM